MTESDADGSSIYDIAFYSVTMDALVNPTDTFLIDNFVAHMPAGAGMVISKSGMEITTNFSLKNSLRWKELLGRPLSVAFSCVQQPYQLLFSLATEFFHSGFLKAFHFSIDEHFMRQIIAREYDDAVKSTTTVNFVGNRSYIWGSDILCGNKPICRHRNVVVSVDMKTRKPTPLDPSWKQRALQHMEDEDIENKQIALPNFQNGGQLIYEFSLKIQQGHLDYNNHANYKTYVFGGFAVIRQAIETHLLAEFENSSYSDVIIHDVIIVFEQESRLGDTVLFSLYKITDGEFTVTCYKNSVRLSYGNYKVSNVSKLMSHL